MTSPTHAPSGRARAVLGIDLGHSGARVALVAEDGSLIEAERRSLASCVTRDRAELDANAWVAGALDAAAGLLARHPDLEVVGLGVGALGPAPVLVSATGRAVAPALLYRMDRRSEPEREALERSLGLVDGGIGHDHALPKLLWLQAHQPHVVATAHHVVDMAGFVVEHLTGEVAVDDVTWAEYYRLPGCATCSVEMELPSPASGIEVAGQLTPGAAVELRRVRLAGVPVVRGGIDSFVDLFAAGLHGPGDAAVVWGSTGVAAVATDVDVEGLVRTSYFGPGHLQMSWTGASGLALEWVVDLVSGGRGALMLPDLLEAAGARKPGSGGLRFDPSMAPGSGAAQGSGSLRGLTLGTTAEDVVRAAIDGVVLELSSCARRSREVGVTPERWLGWGGAMRSPVLQQALADALGASVLVAPGAAAGCGPAELARIVLLGGGPVPSEVVFPDLDRAAIYDDLADQLSRDAYGSTPPGGPGRPSLIPQHEQDDLAR